MHGSCVFGPQVHCVWMGVVPYGSVNGVWSFRMARVVPTRAIASFNMSPVDFSMFFIFVTALIAVLVRVWSWRALRIVYVVGLVFLISVVRCCMAFGDDINAASMFAAMRSVRSNL